jgi:hypothetical protein
MTRAKEKKRERGVQSTWRAGRRGPVAGSCAGRDGCGDRLGENRGAGWRAWAARAECGPDGEEGKWAGPERKQCGFLN